MNFTNRHGNQVQVRDTAADKRADQKDYRTIRVCVYMTIATLCLIGLATAGNLLPTPAVQPVAAQETVQWQPPTAEAEALAYYQGIKDSAYHICNSSRIADTYTEEACGTFLDAHDLDFVCQKRDKLESTVCHVEDISGVTTESE